jgi:hypothetical protein
LVAYRPHRERLSGVWAENPCAERWATPIGKSRERRALSQGTRRNRGVCEVPPRRSIARPDVGSFGRCCFFLEFFGQHLHFDCKSRGKK